MAFVKATIEFKPASVGTGIKCSLRKGKASPAAITLSLNASVAKQANIGNGDGIEVMIGEGDDHGLVRLRKNNSAANTKAEERTTGKGGFFLIKLGHQAAFVNRSEPSAWCKWEPVENSNGFIEIVLPKWADETAPRKQATGGVANIKTAHGVTKLFSGEQPRDAPLKAQPAEPKRNVTASLMGDPPPGRREMMQKMGEMKG
jgi:hypothetical protein